MKIIKALFERSRWKKYKKLLQLFIENGYDIVSLVQFYNEYNPHRSIDAQSWLFSDEKLLLLRHDVDDDPKSAYKMALIEMQLGVRSTFYFRWKTVNNKLIAFLLKNKFEIGLHYESLANYVEFINEHTDSSIDSEFQDKGGLFFNSVRILENEMELFKSRFGGSMTLNSICSHGAQVNRDIRITNYDIIPEPFRMEKNIFEAYDLSQLATSYISDTSSIHGMWRRGENPYKAIKREDKIIYLLIHPCHWGRNVFKRIIFLLYHKLYGIDR